MDPEAQRILRAMTPSQKLKAAMRLSYSARQINAAGLRSQHPDWTRSAWPSARRSSMPEANLFLLFTRKLEALDAPP